MAAERESDPPARASGAGVGEAWRLSPDGGTEGDQGPLDPRPLEAAPPVPPANVKPVVVPRWIQAIGLSVSLLALYALVHAAKNVVLIFLIAAVVALVINPLVSLMQRARIPRGLAVLAVYLGFFASLVGIGVLLVAPVTTQVRNFQRDVPTIVSQANSSLGNLQKWLDKHHIGVKVQSQGQSALQTVEKNVVRGSGSLVTFTTGLVKSLAQGAFNLILILVLSVYMLVYADRIGAVARRVMPPGDGTPDDDYPVRVQKAVFGYVRGQLTFSLIMGTSAGVALWIFGLAGIFHDGGRYALFFGLFYALMELIPFVGPILGAAPPVLVALFENPVTAIWVVLLFLALQQLEGHVVAPQVFGHSLRINPLLIIATLLIGNELFGIVGALIALPIAAVLRETGVYLRRHTVLEPWATPDPDEILAAGRQREPDAHAEPAAHVEPEASAPAEPARRG